mgnify:CR=1 FL=1
MRNDLTELVFIVDRSGSMNSIREAAIGSFNKFLEDQKKGPGEVQVTLVLFDHEYNMLYSGIPIDAADELDATTFVPRGNTALFDAIGRTINEVGSRLAQTADRDRPGSVVVAILTDGNENASREFDAQEIKGMIEEQESKYSWVFAYLSADKDAISDAGKIGIARNMTHQFSANTQDYAKSCGFMSEYATRHRGAMLTSADPLEVKKSMSLQDVVQDCASDDDSDDS